jgi:hypothetical protein
MPPVQFRKIIFYGPIFFAEITVTEMTYLDMLEDWLKPPLNESNDYLFQEDSSRAHYHKSKF